MNSFSSRRPPRKDDDFASPSSFDNSKTSSSVQPMKLVGQKRTPFGTRVLKRIECCKCKETSLIAYIPKHGAPMCDRCALIHLNVAQDMGDLRQQKVGLCSRCRTEMPFDRKQELPVCQACLLNERAELRKVAYKTLGVHPKVVKKSQPMPKAADEDDNELDWSPEFPRPDASEESD